MEWKFMVVQRRYCNGEYEVDIFDKRGFCKEDFPESKQYEQRFCPCGSFEKAVQEMMNSGWNVKYCKKQME